MDDIDAASTGQVTASAAETYEEFFVPALFDQWPDLVLDRSGVSAGDDVLDVGCGTGILARAAARRLGAAGSVTGLDINDGMLEVARSRSKLVSWHHGPAERLPFDDHSFDRVVSQFALMFFADKRAGLDEMVRVVRPGGTITIATWASVDQSPGYAAMIDLLRRLFGDEVADALFAPFTLGSETKLLELAGPSLRDSTVTHHQGVARFDSLEAWIHTDVRGWTLADMISDEQHAQLVEAARTELARFVDGNGAVRFAAPALMLSARSLHEV